MTHGTGFHIVYHMILFIQSDAHISGAIPCIPCCCCCCCYWHECVYMSPLLLRSFPLIFQNPIAPNIQPRNMNSNANGCHLLNELSIRHQNSTSNRFFLKTSFSFLFFSLLLPFWFISHCFWLVQVSTDVDLHWFVLELHITYIVRSFHLHAPRGMSACDSSSICKKHYLCLCTPLHSCWVFGMLLDYELFYYPKLFFLYIQIDWLINFFLFILIAHLVKYYFRWPSHL